MTIKLHHLRPAPGSKTDKTRVGRGEGSKGKTAGRGTKGTKARKNVSAAFEGGQMPLSRRIPKRGFSNFRFAKKYQVVNLADLEERFEAGAEVDVEALRRAFLVRHDQLPVKILALGDLTKGMTVRANAFSAEALRKIEAAGGKAEVI